MYLHKNLGVRSASPDKYPQKRFNKKDCKWCSESFEPQAPSHLYCNEGCAYSAKVNNYLQNTYGVDYEWYNKQLDRQDHLCAICSTEGWTMADHHVLKLVVDHCHSSGRVRGLLCHNCNRGLGLFKDSSTSLVKALKYLESSTTIPEGSTPKQVEKPSPSKEGEDIV